MSGTDGVVSTEAHGDGPPVSPEPLPPQSSHLHLEDLDSRPGTASTDLSVCASGQIVVVEEARDVQEVGGRHHSASRGPRHDPSAPWRLLVVSSKIKNIIAMQTALLPNVLLVQYKYESATLDGILGKDWFLHSLSVQFSWFLDAGCEGCLCVQIFVGLWG